MKKLYTLLFSFTLLLLSFGSCQNEEDAISGGDGFLRLSVVTSSQLETKSVVPENYNPKQLCVEIKNQAGTVVKSTEDVTTWEGQQLKLKAGSYTIVASSNGFDGIASGAKIPYYKGSTQVKVKAGESVSATIECKLANVKVSVNFDEKLKTYFNSAVIKISSKVQGVQAQLFKMNAVNESLYFPEGDLEMELTFVNKAGKSFSQVKPIKNVKARDHYILNYKMQETGSGNIHVKVDPTEHEYNYDITVPVVASTQLSVNTSAVWSRFANLIGEYIAAEAGKTPDLASLKFQYKKEGQEVWSECAAVKDAQGYKAAVRGLDPNTSYSYRFIYDNGGDNFTSETKTLRTEQEVPLYNGTLDVWNKSGKTWYPNGAGKSFWDTSNPGTTTGVAALVNVNPTEPVSENVHTLSGKAAILKSQFASALGIGKFAAGSLYTGKFNSLVGTDGAKIDFGQPFQSRPTQLKGWFKYTAGKIDYVGGSLPQNTVKKGDTDLWSAYIVLTTGTYQLDNTKMNETAKDFGALLADPSDNFVVAYGALPDAQCVSSSDWKQFTVDLVYKNLTAKPTHVIIVFSSSKYGDYFTGSTSSLLYLDDLELVYGDNPKVK